MMNSTADFRIENRIDKQSEEYFENGEVAGVLTTVEIYVNDYRIMSDISQRVEYVPYGYYFYLTYLNRLSDLATGDTVEVHTEGGTKMVVKSEGDIARVSVVGRENGDGTEQYAVPLGLFAREIIAAGGDFVAQILELNPSLEEHRHVETLGESIENARSWYDEEYGDEPTG